MPESVEPFSREFDPPEELEFEEYQDPFILNEDGTIDLDLSGKATIRGERLRVIERLRVDGEVVIDEDLKVKGEFELQGSAVIDGNLTVSGNKSFDIPHVKILGKRVRHVVAEGPEAGIYVRGKLKDSNEIELPEYWDGLIDPETITVTLTQIGYSQDLIVERIDWGKIIRIKSGNGANINCYYDVWASRWIDPMNHDEKLHVVYDGETPNDYPGDNKNFLVGGWDYDKRDPQWG